LKTAFSSKYAPAADSALVHGTEAALFSVLNFHLNSGV